MRIETERLVLRGLEEKDAEGLYRLNANPRVDCYMDGKDTTPEKTLDYIRSDESKDDLAVCLKENDRFIGLLFGADGEEEGHYSPCWNFLPEYGGKGYAYEAAHAWFDWLFNERGYRRLYAYTEEDNIPSQNLCRRLGMRQEGLFREFVSFVNNPDGTPKYENTMQFAILKKEWDADITKQVSIEEANHDDMPVLEAIHDAAFDTDMRYFPDGKLPGPEEGEFAPTSSEALDLPGYTILKVLLNGKIVGGACVSAAKNGIREIEEFYISPEYMGRNIGATTLSLVEDYFPNTKVYRLITPTQVMKNIVFYVNKCHYHIVEVAGYDRKQECGDYVFEKRMTR